MVSRPPGSLFPPSIRSVLARVTNPLWSLAALVVIIWGLKEASAVLVPITVAAMLAIICSPAVRWLGDRKVPLGLAVAIVVAAMMAALAGMGVLVGGSLASFSDALPEYRHKLKAMTEEGALILQGYGVKLPSYEPSELAGQAMGLVSSSMNALVSALSNVFLVVLTMVLILLEGKSVPVKLRALAGDPEADISYFQEIAKQVQSYLAIKTVVSLAMGVLAGVWAAILDVDFAILWGLLAFLLNYIPNIGAFLAAIPAMLLALVQHGPGVAIALGVGHVVMHMVIGNVLEPMWMGRRLGLSTTVVFLSLAVWYEMWGPVGMLLSVPLTMVLKIMLEHSPDYANIAHLLDSPSEPVVPDPAPMPPLVLNLPSESGEPSQPGDDGDRATQPAAHDADGAADEEEAPPTSRSPPTTGE